MTSHSRSSTPLFLALVGVAAMAVVGVSRLQRGEEVVVIGDSMADFAKQDLISQGDAAGYDVKVDGVPGVPLSARLDAINAAAAGGTNRLVIELGTNDLFKDATSSEMDQAIDTAVADVASVRCVVFVNVGILEGPTDAAAHFNAHLLAQINAHPNLHQYDWASDYAGHPDWSADTIHLKAPFWKLYAANIIHTVDQSCT